MAWRGRGPQTTDSDQVTFCHVFWSIAETFTSVSAVAGLPHTAVNKRRESSRGTNFMQAAMKSSRFSVSSLSLIFPSDLASTSARTVFTWSVWSSWSVLLCNTARTKELIVFWFKKSKRLVGSAASFPASGKSASPGTSGKGSPDTGGTSKDSCATSKLAAACFPNSRRRLVGKSMPSETAAGLLRRSMMPAH